MRLPARLSAPLGGPDDTWDIEHQALLDALAPGWDVGEDTALYAETRVDAFAVTLVWAINKRIANQCYPRRMLDMLADYETATKLRPAPTDSLVDRRRRLAAKLRGVVKNALVDIEDTASEILGVNYVATVTVPTASQIAYWPGVNPGPPGYEFSSNRAHVCIHMNKNGLNEQVFRAKRDALIEALDNMRPAWLTFTVGVGTGDGTDFVCDEGIVGQTILGE